MHIHRFCLLSVFVSAIALQAQVSDKMPPLIDPQQDNIALADMNDPNAAMTLQLALALAVANNPELMAYSWETRAQDGKILQAGLLPNPELELAAEQVGGTGGYQGFNSAQTTVQITQTIQLGNKRLKNKQLAVLDKSLAVWDYEAKRLDIWMEVIKTYVENLAIQQRLELDTELLSIAQQMKNVVADKVAAGKVSPVEETKAFVVLSSVQIELARTMRNLTAAQKNLAALWGGEPKFSKVEGDLTTLQDIPDQKQFLESLAQNPDIARWDTELKHRNAALEVEKSKAIGDLTVFAGSQQFRETDDAAFVFGITIPLPLFDRNQGAISEAKSRASKAHYQSQAENVRVKTAISQAYQQLMQSFEQAKTLETKIIPGAQSVFDAAQEGYKYGKFSHLEMLDAQRTLFEVKQQYIETLASYHKARADVNRLVGDNSDIMK